MESLRFTSYSFDPVIGKYFAQARFYDSARGRMLSMDPVKSGLNRYSYCDNDPVNYEDADGEFFQGIAGFGVGFTSYFAFHFVGSVVSQLIDGKGINWRQALGEGVNAGITGGVKVAEISSGVGLPLSAGLDFIAGTLGDAAERWIVDGEINPLKSITSGANNAIGGVIYGKDPLKSVGSALVRGGGSGAVTGGINYISEALGSVGQTGAGAYRGMAGALVSGALSSYISGRDPRSGCGSSGMSGQGLGYSTARGYQYSTGQAEIPQGRKEKFSLGGFFQRVLTEGVTEALSSAGSFGLGKVLDVVKRGIQGRKNRVPGGSKGGTVVDISNPVLGNIRSGSALKGDSLHAFNDIIDNYAGDATQFLLIGGDGVKRTLYQLEGSLNGKKGIFEWIIDPDPTKGVTHRRFIEGVVITGKPNSRR